jgi:hypothetical protein
LPNASDKAITVVVMNAHAVPATATTTTAANVTVIATTPCDRGASPTGTNAPFTATDGTTCTATRSRTRLTDSPATATINAGRRNRPPRLNVVRNVP